MISRDLHCFGKHNRPVHERLKMLHFGDSDMLRRRSSERCRLILIDDACDDVSTMPMQSSQIRGAVRFLSSPRAV